MKNCCYIISKKNNLYKYIEINFTKMIELKSTHTWQLMFIPILNMDYRFISLGSGLAVLICLEDLHTVVSKFGSQ